MTYSSGDMAIALQEVLSRTLRFNRGAYTNLPPSIKVILDNRQSAFTLRHHGLFQRTLKALEIHLVNLEARNEAITSKLFAKEDTHSTGIRTIMGTDYTRLSLKTQNQLRSALANLPTEIQISILGSKAMFESPDQWFKHFKILVTITFSVFDEESDSIDDIFMQARWEEYFGTSLRVYEMKQPFPGF